MKLHKGILGKDILNLERHYPFAPNKSDRLERSSLFSILPGERLDPDHPKLKQAEKYSKHHTLAKLILRIEFHPSVEFIFHDTDSHRIWPVQQLKQPHQRWPLPPRPPSSQQPLPPLSSSASQPTPYSPDDHARQPEP